MTFDWREPLELGERWFQEVAETNILKVTADIKAPFWPSTARTILPSPPITPRRL